MHTSTIETRLCECGVQVGSREKRGARAGAFVSAFERRLRAFHSLATALASACLYMCMRDAAANVYGYGCLSA